MTKKLSILCFSVLMIFVVLSTALAGLAGAQTLVAGKIYNSDYSSVVSGASVLVTCTSTAGSFDLSTTSLDDGTYAVRFNESECTVRDTVGDTVKVSASKNTLSGENSGTVIACEGDGCTESDYVSVLNLNIKTENNNQNTNTNSNSNSGSSSSSS